MGDRASSVKSHWAVLVLVDSIGVQKRKLDVSSIAQVPGAAPFTCREKPEGTKTPLSTGGAVRTENCPRVSQPTRLASCVVLAKRSGMPFVIGFCAPIRRVYCPAGKPGLGR